MCEYLLDITIFHGSFIYIENGTHLKMNKCIIQANLCISDIRLFYILEIVIFVKS